MAIDPDRLEDPSDRYAWEAELRHHGRDDGRHHLPYSDEARRVRWGHEALVWLAEHGAEHQGPE